MQGPPQPGAPRVGEAPTQQPGHHDQHEQIRGNRAEAEVEGPAPGEERDHGVGGPGPAGQHLSRDVGGKEHHSGERGGPVCRLGGDPAAG
jgi:hypothetical protein